MKIKILIASLILLTCVACKELFLDEDEANTPENNFELFWRDFNEHYALFQVRGKNWDSIYQVFRPKVNEQTSPDVLWNVFTSMIEYLDDSHTVLFFTDDEYAYTSGATLGDKAEAVFRIELVLAYLTGIRQVPGEKSILYGHVFNRDIGYIFIGAEDGKDPEGAILGVLEELKHHKAIILDLRTNHGGDKQYAKIIAGAFSDGEHLVGTTQTRNGPKHSDFNAKVDEITTTTGPEQFTKPVIVLTDRATISAGEYLALHMRQFKHVRIIGDSTAGDFSAIGMRRFLPNGWTYQYSVQMLLLPDGRSLDGIGIAPDVHVKNKIQDLQSGNDRVIERALTYLRSGYGI